jgi:RecA/RadA recombinase
MPITAREALEKQNSYQKISTGSPELDSLIGGISEGTSYLFYGDHDCLSSLVHQMLVNCATPMDQGGFDSKAFYFNNTNYYTARTTLSPTRLGEFSKKLCVEPSLVFQKVQVAAAYNEERQKLVCEEIVRALSSERNENSRLVVLHNATCFLPDATNFTKSLQGLSYVVGKLKEVCSRKRVLVVTASQFGNSNSRRIPKTMGGSFFQALDERDGSPSQMEGWSNAFGQSDASETSRIRERTIRHPERG